jgi:hypothetical protein
MKTKGLYPSVVGLLLGLMQTGLFFQLSFTLSSSFGTFLLITICWLVGSSIGILYLARISLPTLTFLALALLAYGVVAALLALAPFMTSLWPLHGLLVLLIGFYPGVFFVRCAPLYRAQTLFSRENNGFIAGIVIGTVLFMLAGRIILYALPLTVALVVVWFSYRLHILGRSSSLANDVAS